MYAFSADQLAIMSLYRTGSKEELVADLQESIPYVDDLEISAHMAVCIDELARLSEYKFSILIFCIT